jgi:hypothetical protein
LQRKSAQKQTLTKPPDDGGGQHVLLKISAPTTDHALQLGARWALCMGKTSYFRYRAEANVKLEATPKKAAHFIATLAMVTLRINYRFGWGATRLNLARRS